MKLFLKDAHFERQKGNSMQIFELNLTRRLEDKYQPRSYAERWKGVRMAALITSYLFNVYSFATGAAAVFLFIFAAFLSLPWWLNLLISIGAGCAFAFILEVFKRKTAAETFSRGYSTGSWSVSGLAGMAALTALSIFLSFFAAVSFPRSTTPPPAAHTPDETHYGSFEDAIKYRKEQAAAIKQQRQWQGRIGNKDQEEINKLNAQVAKIEADYLAHRQAARHAADQKTQQALKDYETNMSKMELLAGWVTVATELFFLLCFLYIERYDWKAALERIELSDAAQPTPTPAGPTAVTPITSASAQPHQAPPISRIGFKFYDPDDSQEHTVIEWDKAKTQRFAFENSAPHKEGHWTTWTKEQIEEAKAFVNKEVERIESNGTHIPYEEPTQSVEQVKIEVIAAEKFCEWCSEAMDYVSKRKTYCSDKCRWAAYNDRKNKGGGDEAT
jgi:hypothetical protein